MNALYNGQFKKDLIWRTIVFKYKVRYWDDVENKVLDEIGLVAAKSLGKAINKVQDYYGKNNVYEVTIEEWEDILWAEAVIEGLTE